MLCAYNSQLLLKDGLKLEEAYYNLIKRISKDIVSKPKVSLLIAEQLRNLECNSTLEFNFIYD
jgi:hypothetical protein